MIDLISIETLITIFVSLFVFAATIIYWKLIRPQKRIYDIFRAQGIDGEAFIPLIGDLPEMRRYRQSGRIMDFYPDLAKKYGNLYLFCLGPIVRLAVLDPDLIADMLSRNNASNYQKPPIFDAVFAPITGKMNLFVAADPEHERARRMINPAFHHVSLKAMTSIMSHQASKTITDLLRRSREKNTIPIDLQFEFNILTLAVIAATAFGTAFEKNAAAKEIINRTFGEVLDATVDRSLKMITLIPMLSKLPFWKKDVVDQGARIIGELVDQIIADRRQGVSSSLSDGPDLLDLLLSAVDDHGQSFTDQQVKQHALTFVLAGSETTGNLMAWIFAVFMTHPDVLEACREEVDRILCDGKEPTYEDLNQLFVCEAVINETLRLYPPAPVFVRYCIRNHEIGSDRRLFIPAGSTLAVHTYALHRHPQLWSRPNEFDYSRWLRDANTGIKPKLPHAFAYLPFAAGSRNCIGQNFALLEAKILLSMSIQKCQFDFVPGQKVAPDFKVSLRVKNGVLAHLTERHV